MLEQIKLKVEERVNQSNTQIIMGMYQNMIRAHNDHCGCNYCVKLKDYVQLKKYLSAQHRRMNGFDYDYHENINVLADLSGIRRIKEEIKRLKIEKDNLKILV